MNVLEISSRFSFKDGVNNNGELKIYPSDFLNRDNGDDKRQFTFGFIQLNLTTPDPIIKNSPLVPSIQFKSIVKSVKSVKTFEKYWNSLNSLENQFF